METPSIGEDVFGAEFAGREKVFDAQNKDLFIKMMLNYRMWQEKTGTFHPTFQQDFNRIQRYNYYRYVGAGVGVMFAGVVWNPNFVNRRSWYMRKIAIAAWALVGYEFTNRFFKDQITITMLKMNDYYPLEIKRALQDKDFRHIGLFDPEAETKAGRLLFDPVSGKSLS